MSSDNISTHESKKQKSEQTSKNKSVPDFVPSTSLPTVVESQSCSLDVHSTTETNETPMPNQESDIGLDWLNLGGVSSPSVADSVESTAQYEKNMRIQPYQPPKPFKAIIEETKYGLLAPTSYQVSVVEPKIELLSPSTHRAVVEEQPNYGILKAADGTEIIILSDDEEFPLKDINETYESADEVMETNETNVDLPILLSAIDSHCCARRMRERETQTPKGKHPSKRQRTRVCIAQISGRKPTGLAGTSSDCASSEAPHKVKITTQGQNSFKQRQLELHRLRMTVETKRLELLDLKLTRERDEMLRESILFEKELELKNVQVSKLNDDHINI